MKYYILTYMTKDKTEAIKEDTPTVVIKEIAKTCSCNESIGRDIRCSDHGDPDKI
jgi:hypothetical protein